VCELNDESSNKVQCDAKTCKVVRLSGNRIEGQRDVGCDRKDAGHDWRTDKTWGDEVYGILWCYVCRLMVVQERERYIY
jgi:hypothetical protein